jgi:predicted transcriptional regulator
MISVRLNEEILRKISTLMKIKQTTRTEVIKKAISEYYERHAQDLSPFELGKDLFGKYGVGKTLSINYKKKIKERLDEKHPH